MGCGASQPLEEERRSLVSEGKPGASSQWSRAEYENGGGGVHQRAPSPRRGGGNNGDGWRKQSPRPAEDEEPTSPRRPTKKTRTPRGHNDHDDAQSMEQMALALAMAALKQDSSDNSSAHSRGDEEAKARALATAMVAWVEAHLAEGRAIGRPPRHNFCFKCGAALHAAATFCADCGLKLPREGDTESWREREARLKREREEKERKEEEDRKRRTEEFNSTGAHSSPAKLEASSRPKPRPMKKDMSGLSLLGETEEQFRKRQNLERQESQQTLYGLDAELREKEREKLSMAEYRKLVDDAMLWLERILGDRGVGEFPDNLKSGRVLCGLINKFWPGMIPQVGDRPIPLIERENIRLYLEACEKVGVRKQDLFVISDLYEERYLAGVILNLYALAPIIQRQSSFSGPVLVRYA